MSSYDYPRTLRLLNSGDFRYVFHDVSIKAGHPGLLMLARQTSAAYPRLGTIVSKKNVKLAVERNRVKRLVREVFRNHRELLNGLEIVVIARKPIVGMNNAEVLSCTIDLFGRIVRKNKNLSNEALKTSK